MVPTEALSLAHHDYAFYRNSYRHELSATFIFIVKKERSEFALNSDRPFILLFYFTSNSTLSNNFFTALLSRNLSAFSTIGRVKCGEKNSIKSYI